MQVHFSELEEAWICTSTVCTFLCTEDLAAEEDRTRESSRVASASFRLQCVLVPVMTGDGL